MRQTEFYRIGKSAPLAIDRSLIWFCVLILILVMSAGLKGQDTSHVGDDPGLKRLANEIERLSKPAQGVVGVSVIHLETV